MEIVAVKRVIYSSIRKELFRNPQGNSVFAVGIELEQNLDLTNAKWLMPTCLKSN